MNANTKSIIEFLTEYVIGRNLKTDDTIYQLEEGKLEGVYSDEMFFSNLLISITGFHFDMTTITREKIYFLDKNNKRIGIKKDYTGTSVFHYEFSIRKSSMQLTGIMRLYSSTVKEHTMDAIVYGVYDCNLNDKDLSWKEQQLLYRDMPTQNDNYKSVAFDSKVRFYLENGKLRFEYTPLYCDVNPVTFEKLKSKDQYPIFLSKET